MLTVKALPETLSTQRQFGHAAVPEWATHAALITGAESLDNIELFERMVATVSSQKKEETFDAWELGITNNSRDRVVVWWFRKSDADPTVISRSSIFPFIPGS
jgi:hypothetical protein